MLSKNAGKELDSHKFSRIETLLVSATPSLTDSLTPIPKPTQPTARIHQMFAGLSLEKTPTKEIDDIAN